MTYISERDARVGAVMATRGISVSVSEGRAEELAPSRVYADGGRAWTARVTVAGGRGTEPFLLATGPGYTSLSPMAALCLLLETADGAKEETYDRWLREGGTDTLHALDGDDELALAYYEEGHDVYTRLVSLVGEEGYRELTRAALGVG